MAYEEKNPSVLWNVDQTGVLSDAEQHQARKNIGLTNASGETSEDKYWARKGKGGLATLDETNGKVETSQLYSEFAKVKVTNGESSKILEADQIQDTVEIVAGSGITLVADDTNDKFTIQHTNDVNGPQYVKNAWSDSHFAIPNLYFDQNGHLAQSADKKIPPWTTRAIHPGVKGTGVSGIIFSLDDDNAPETCNIGIGHSNQITAGQFGWQIDSTCSSVGIPWFQYDGNGHITKGGTTTFHINSGAIELQFNENDVGIAHTQYGSGGITCCVDDELSTGGKLVLKAATYDNYGHINGVASTEYVLPTASSTSYQAQYVMPSWAKYDMSDITGSCNMYINTDILPSSYVSSYLCGYATTFSSSGQATLLCVPPHHRGTMHCSILCSSGTSMTSDTTTWLQIYLGKTAEAACGWSFGENFLDGLYCYWYPGSNYSLYTPASFVFRNDLDVSQYIICACNGSSPPCEIKVYKSFELFPSIP